MVEFRAATDLCNDKLAIQRNYETKRRTIASYMKSKAGALEKAIDEGHINTGVDVDIYRQEAYQFVIEASL